MTNTIGPAPATSLEQIEKTGETVRKLDHQLLTACEQIATVQMELQAAMRAAKKEAEFQGNAAYREQAAYNRGRDDEATKHNINEGSKMLEHTAALEAAYQQGRDYEQAKHASCMQARFDEGRKLGKNEAEARMRAQTTPPVNTVDIEIKAYNKGYDEGVEAQKRVEQNQRQPYEKSPLSKRAELCLKVCNGATNELLEEIISGCETDTPLASFVNETGEHTDSLEKMFDLMQAVIALKCRH